MRRFAARWAVPLAALVVVGCGGGVGEVRRVVVVTLDTTRPDRLGCYGYPQAQTPNLDAFAREAVQFEETVAVAPTTLPSHCTIFTGLNPQDHKVHYNLMYRLGAEQKTLAEYLKDAGFATAGFPAAHVVNKTFGLDQGFDTWVDPPSPSDPSMRAGSDTAGVGDLYDLHPDAVLRPAGEQVDLALDWLDAHAAEKTFMWVHFYDPHWPYDPPFPYSDRFRDRPYDGEIAYTDAEFGRLLARLRADPEWSRTMVVVAGDHGEGLYEHGERYHALLIYQSTQRVPFIVRAPGARPRRVAVPVGLVDITPTVLDVLGIAPSSPMRGISLRATLEGATPPARDLYYETLAGAVTYGWQELKGLRTGRFSLIDSAQPELYDLAEDPHELTNLAGLEVERLADFRAALQRLAEPIGSQDSRDSSPAQPTLDPQLQATLASLGYVGGQLGASVGQDAPHPARLIHLQAELLNAQGAVGRKHWGLVENVCRYVLGEDPTNFWAMANLTVSLLEQNRPEEALEPAFEWIRLLPNGEFAWMKLAEVRRALGQYEEAHEALATGLERVPRSEQLRYLFVVSSFDVGPLEACSTAVPEAIAAQPKSGRILVMRARCELRAGDNAAALATLGAARDLGFRDFEALERQEEFAGLVGLGEWKTLQAEATAAAASGAGEIERN